MPHKESYRNLLPHFQQSGQAYFITWNLIDSVPPKALLRYKQELELLKMKITSGAVNSDSPIINAIRESQYPLKGEYYSIRKKYLKAYNNILDTQMKSSVDLSKSENTKVIIDTLLFWQNKKLINHALCVMPNHVHWVVETLAKDDKGNPVFLEDILKSVKRYSANRINQIEKRKGNLWQKESFDTTIRDEKHLYYAIEYTLNNPVKAGFVSAWYDWPGSQYFE